MLCQYKNMFGQPHQGIHSYRIGPLALVDVVGTVLLAWWIHWMYPKTLSFGWALVGCFGLGMVCHYVFCVQTALHQWITSWVSN